MRFARSQIALKESPTIFATAPSMASCPLSTSSRVKKPMALFGCGILLVELAKKTAPKAALKEVDAIERKWALGARLGAGEP
jgi:hypothetical protein